MYNVYIIAKKELEFTSCAMLYKWMDICDDEHIAHVTLKNYTSVFSKIYNSVTTDNPVFIFLGLPKDCVSKLENDFNLKNFVFANKGIRGFTLKSILPTVRVKLSDEQILYLKYVLDWCLNMYKYNESYKLNSLYMNLHISYFLKLFDTGYTVIPKEFNKIIYKHYEEFSNSQKPIYANILNYNIPTVVGKLKYIDDYFKVVYESDNNELCLIDLELNRVFFKKNKNSKIPILDICKKLCNGVGDEYVCNGELNQSFFDTLSSLN